MRDRLGILFERVIDIRGRLGMLLERVTGMRERSGSPSARSSGTRGRLSVLGLLAFVLVDVVLVVLAVRHTNATPPPADLAKAGQNTGAEATGTENPDAESSGTKPRQRDAVVRQPLYTSLSPDGSYVRATRGDCEGDVQPVVEVSTDGGRTFTQSAIPGLTEVLRAQADSAANLWLIGTNRACDVLIYGTGDGGVTWDRSSGSDGLWYLAPDDSTAASTRPASVSSTPRARRSASPRSTTVSSVRSAPTGTSSRPRTAGAHGHGSGASRGPSRSGSPPPTTGTPSRVAMAAGAL